MSKKSLVILGASALVILLVGGLIYFLAPRLGDLSTFSASPQGSSRLPADTVQARVIQIIEEGEITLGDNAPQTYQILLVQLLEGQYAGRQVIIDYGQRQIRPEGLRLQPDEKILVTVGKQPDGQITAYFTDYVRTNSLLWLVAAFVILTILISGWKGVRSLIGLVLSFMVIIAYIIPQILGGEDPVRVSIIGAFFLLATTLYLVYGWTLKTHAAAIGMLIALLITGLLSGIFVNLTRLTGYSDENAMFLVQMAETQINLRGLVLAGMLIGALGVLDDLVATQSSAVFELRATDPELNLHDLYTTAMRIGSDHVAATVNTLFMAYAGAALPMLLLFSLSGERYGYLVNLEFVTEEIVRTLVGSLGLIMAVPITTLLASLFALYNQRLGSLRRYLGPDNSGSSGHSHTHA